MEINELLIHSRTKRLVEAALAGKHHGVCLVGQSGSGKTTLANAMCKELNENSPGLSLRLGSDGQPVGIDDVRQIRAFLKLKASGNTTTVRVVIIENVETMSKESQNALLKLLEEPGHNIWFILTANNLSDVSQTIRSRIMTIKILPIDIGKLNQYLLDTYNLSQQDATKISHLSDGYPAIAVNLATSNDSQLVDSIGIAKAYLSNSVYNRIGQTDVIAKDQESFTRFLFCMKRVLSAAAEYQNSNAGLELIANKLRSVYDAERQLRNNPNLKLLATKLALQI